MNTKQGDRNEGTLQVAVSFPVEFRQLAPDETEETAAEVATHRTSDRMGVPGPGNELPSELNSLRDYQDASPLTMKIWLSIERKLDTLIRLTGEAAHPLPHAEQGVVKTLSAAACTLRSKKVLKTGDTLHLRLTPPSYPPFTVDAVGRVASIAEAGEWELEYGVSFTALNHDDAESLISYIFKRQREIVRGRQNEKSA